MSLTNCTEIRHLILKQSRILPLVAILVVCFVSACVYVPKQVDDQDQINAGCHLSTHSYTLTTKQLDMSGNINIDAGDAEANRDVLVLFGIVIPVGSFVVSGSMVAAGNTLHWIEYQGKCSDGLIAKFEKTIHGNLTR